MRLILVFCLLLLIVLVSCNKDEPTPNVQYDDKWEQSFDSYIEEGLKDATNLNKYNSNKYYWFAFFKALAMAESSLNRYEIYWESKLGNPPGYDSKTQMKYLSEGLLQLSYSDYYYYNCNFDVEGDRNKKEQDTSKTIFDPKNNLQCGVIILNRLVGKYNQLYFDTGHYWAVLKPSNARHSVFLKHFESTKKEYGL